MGKWKKKSTKKTVSKGKPKVTLDEDGRRNRREQKRQKKKTPIHRKYEDQISMGNISNISAEKYEANEETKKF